MLKAIQITKNFGGLKALEKIDLNVEAGELVGLIGPNGAGKTTFFNVISGFAAPSEGKITFLGEKINGLKPHQIAAKGLVRTFQATKLFANLSVLDNIKIGYHLFARGNIFSNVLGLLKEKEKTIENSYMSILEITGLENVKDEIAKNLSHGYQRILGLGVALSSKPKLLCLDEPVTGMNAAEKKFMMNVVKTLQEQGITILVIEHDMKVIMGVCNRVVVLNFGKKIAEGTCTEVQNNAEVIKAYIGSLGEDVIQGY
jgi:branched-chain amino acid transport system ATP-binding protein